MEKCERCEGTRLLPVNMPAFILMFIPALFLLLAGCIQESPVLLTKEQAVYKKQMEFTEVQKLVLAYALRPDCTDKVLVDCRNKQLAKRLAGIQSEITLKFREINKSFTAGNQVPQSSLDEIATLLRVISIDLQEAAQ